MKIKIRKSDSLFSKYIRTKARWTCERCNAKHEIGSQGLHASHFYGRASESTRFDEENVDCLCFGCHNYFHAQPNEYVEWKKKKMGEKKFNMLTIRAKATFKKRDDKLDVIYCKKLLEEIKNL